MVPLLGICLFLRIIWVTLYVFVFETGSHYILLYGLAGLELSILNSELMSSEFWDKTHSPPCLAKKENFNCWILKCMFLCFII